MKDEAGRRGGQKCDNVLERQSSIAKNEGDVQRNSGECIKQRNFRGEVTA